MPAVGADKVCQQVSVSCLFIKVYWTIFTPPSLKPKDLHMHKTSPNNCIDKHINCVYLVHSSGYISELSTS